MGRMGGNLDINGQKRNSSRAVYIGHDHRQPLAYNVMRYSVESRASKPISVNGLFLNQLPITREGATEFTFSRFLVPYLMSYEPGSMGIFADEDMVVSGDIWELFAFCSKLQGDWDVAVVKEDLQRYEWPSLMVFNNANCTTLTPDFVDSELNKLFDFAWTSEERIAELPPEWNHCVGYQKPKKAKLYHWTQGIPFWPECRGLEEDEHWYDAFDEMKHSVDWIELHAGTKHFSQVMSRMLSRYGIAIEKK